MKIRIFLLFVIATGIIGCAHDSTESMKRDSVARVNPDSLSKPEKRLCAKFNEDISYSYNSKVGFSDVVWKIGLDKGIYVSEWEDKNGIYYRAPAGGLNFSRYNSTMSELEDQASQDGGIWVPRDQSVPPRLYTYVSYEHAKKSDKENSLECSEIMLKSVSGQQGLSLISMASGGAIGGATAKMTKPNIATNYGQSMVAGAISGILVGYLANLDVGKIVVRPEVNDQYFLGKVKENFKNPTILNSLEKEGN